MMLLSSGTGHGSDDRAEVFQDFCSEAVKLSTAFLPAAGGVRIYILSIHGFSWFEFVSVLGHIFVAGVGMGTCFEHQYFL